MKYDLLFLSWFSFLELGYFESRKKQKQFLKGIAMIKHIAYTVAWTGIVAVYFGFFGVVLWSIA